jgi:hypothetical protein
VGERAKSTPVLDFLLELAKNQPALVNFQNDPAGTARSAGLSEEQLRILQSRDKEAITRLVDEETAAGEDRPVPVTISITLVF